MPNAPRRLDPFHEFNKVTVNLHDVWKICADGRLLLFPAGAVDGNFENAESARDFFMDHGIPMIVVHQYVQDQAHQKVCIAIDQIHKWQPPQYVTAGVGANIYNRHCKFDPKDQEYCTLTRENCDELTALKNEALDKLSGEPATPAHQSPATEPTAQ